tara:strand:- start:6923 stop:7672 length:750 start_codon:yes stop_codon:yes gene_type:complete
MNNQIIMENYFYDLPDEIINLIVFEEHKLRFNKTLKIIQHIKIATAVAGAGYMRYPLNEDYWLDYENNETLYADWVAQTVETFRRISTNDIRVEIYLYNVVRNLMSCSQYRASSVVLANKSTVCFNLLPIAKILDKLYAYRTNVENKLQLVAREASMVAINNVSHNITKAMARASWADKAQEDARYNARCAISIEKQALSMKKENKYITGHMNIIINTAKLNRQAAQWILVEAIKVNSTEARTLKTMCG